MIQICYCERDEAEVSQRCGSVVRLPWAIRQPRRATSEACYCKAIVLSNHSYIFNLRSLRPLDFCCQFELIYNVIEATLDFPFFIGYTSTIVFVTIVTK